MNYVTLNHAEENEKQRQICFDTKSPRFLCQPNGQKAKQKQINELVYLRLVFLFLSLLFAFGALRL